MYKTSAKVQLFFHISIIYNVKHSEKLRFEEHTCGVTCHEDPYCVGARMHVVRQLGYTQYGNCDTRYIVIEIHTTVFEGFSIYPNGMHRASIVGYNISLVRMEKVAE